MARPLLSTEALPVHRAQAIAACGRPVTLIRKSGRTSETLARCSDLYCSTCGPMRARKAFACIMAALEGGESEAVYMVTLTRRAIRQQKATKNAYIEQIKADIDADIEQRKDLQRQIERDRAQWTATTARLRKADYLWRRYAETGERRYLRESMRTVRPVEVQAGSTDGACSTDSQWSTTRGWRGEAGVTSYIWAREITRGASGQIWHVHRHVICPDLTTAQRVLAAYAMYKDEIQGDTPYVASIQRWTVEQAGGYLAGYISGTRQKDGGWHSVASRLSVSEQALWVEATKGMRRHDAAGKYRPLGIGYRPEVADTLVAVADSGGVYAAKTYYKRIARKPKTQEISRACTLPGNPPCSGIEQTAQALTAIVLDSSIVDSILTLDERLNGRGWAIEANGVWIDYG